MELVKEFLENGHIEDLSELLNYMVENIGSTDPILRDQLIYRAFCKLISEKYLSVDQRNELLSTMLGEQYYLHNIGEQQTDSVFQRSFSALVLALLLEFDSEDLQLHKDLVNDAFTQAIYYMEQELDRRGYVKGKGWAHAIAHGADVLDAAAKHPDFNDTQGMLNSLQVPLLSGHPFTDDEEERLAIPVISLISYKHAEEEVLNWLNQLINHTNQLQPEYPLSIHPYRVQHTVKHFLKSLYFFLQFKDESKAVRDQVKEHLKKWSYF